MHASDSVIKVLVGNKSDIDDRQVSAQEGQRLADEMGVKFFETSAKTGANIEDLFVSMAEEVKRKLDQEDKVGVLSYTGSKLHKHQDKKEKDECC